MNNIINNQQPNSQLRFSIKMILLWILVGLVVLTGYFSWQWWEINKLQEPTSQTEKVEKWIYFPKFDYNNNIYFDEDGKTIWVASIGGLHRYDRSENKIIKTYTMVDGISPNATAVIKIGNKLYVGVQGNGIAVLDLATDKFEYIYNKDNHSLNSNIYHFEYDGKTLWMTTFGGLIGLDIDNLIWRNYSHRDSDFTVIGDNIYLIDRSNTTSIVWRADKNDGLWKSDFELTGSEWMYIDGNEKYIVASADPKDYKGRPVLYYKNLLNNNWQEIKLPISVQNIRYRRLTLGKDGKVYFAYGENINKEMLGVYDIENGIFNKYQLQKLGMSVGSAGMGNLYIHPSQREVWFSQFGYIDLDSKKEYVIIDQQAYPEFNFNDVLAARNEKLIVNTNLGVGIFELQKNKFTKISERRALGAEWIEDFIWLDLSVHMMDDENLLGRYDIKNGLLEIKELEHQFSFIKNQKLQDENSILIEVSLYPMLENQTSIKQIASFDFTQKKINPLLEINSSSIPYYNEIDNSMIFSELYGILINTIDGIRSFNLQSKEYKLIFKTEFVPVFTLVRGNNLFVLSDAGDVYRLDKINNSFILIFNYSGPEFKKPNDFDMIGKNIIIKSFDILDNYYLGVDVGFGTNGFSFYRNQVLLIDSNGVISKSFNSLNGMMAVNFDIDAVSDDGCIWFSDAKGYMGVWGYCGLKK